MSQSQHSDASQALAQLTDPELVRRMLAASNGDHMRALFDGDIEALRTKWGYETVTGMRYRLLFNLAFWTREDETRMARLYERSALSADHLPGFNDTQQLVWRTLRDREDDADLYTPAGSAR